MRLPEFMREVARRCRFRSRETFDLTAAQELRQTAADLEDTALQCEGIVRGRTAIDDSSTPAFLTRRAFTRAPFSDMA